MSYLLDRKTRQKKYIQIVLLAVLIATLFYFRGGIFNILSSTSAALFRPALVAGESMRGKLRVFGSYFISKKNLFIENEKLRSELSKGEARMINYDSILADNAALREILGRKKESSSLVVSAILSKPNQSPYDTLVIDAGSKLGLSAGDIVFASGGAPIGRIGELHTDSSKVILFSASGIKTDVVLPESNIFTEIWGRGGGNFEMSLPADFAPEKGDELVLPGMTPHVVGIVQNIVKDPREPFAKALIISPVNIQHLKFVEVKIN